MRRALGEQRIGHTGTLDPAATGVLPLVIGRATRLARFLSASDKSYEAVVRLGTATDTHDGAGTPAGPSYPGALPPREAVDRALDDVPRNVSAAATRVFGEEDRRPHAATVWRDARSASAAPPCPPFPLP